MPHCRTENITKATGSLAVALFLFLTVDPVLAQSAFETAVRGAACRQNANGSLNCTYTVGHDLEFSITAAGEADAGISFIRSSIKGDYYARFGVLHGCIIVAQGEARTQPAPIDFAYISPKNGRVYKSWQECQSGK